VDKDNFATLDGEEVEHTNYPADTDHQSCATTCDMMEVEFLDRDIVIDDNSIKYGDHKMQ